MDHPFDEFSKSLAESLPRRESLRRLGALFAGALLGPLALGSGTASATPDTWKKRPKRPLGVAAAKAKGSPPGGGQDPCKTFCSRCRTKAQQNECLTACRACNNNPSRLCGTCGTYTCANLSSDPNCGACGNNCGAMGQTCCSGRCADLKSDPGNCGGCGRVCGGSTPYCSSGICSACAPGQTKCGSACIDLSSDPANCGACGNVCGGPNPHCYGGVCSQCTPSCPEGWCGGDG